MRNETEVSLMGADTKPLYSGLDELDEAYEDISAYVAAIWGQKNSYEDFCMAMSMEVPYAENWGHRKIGELGIVQADFHRELLRAIRCVRVLVSDFPLYGPEVNVHMGRWIFDHIMAIANEFKDLLEANTPIDYDERLLYYFAFEKLSSAISFHRFLSQAEPCIPRDPSYRGELPQWVEQLIAGKKESRLIPLLTDSRAFTPTDVDGLLIYLEAIDKGSRTWRKTKPGNGGNQSAFPAAYAALLKTRKMILVPHTSWAKIFRAEYEAEFSDSAAEKAAEVPSSGVKVLDDYYRKAVEWITTPQNERGNL